MFNIQPGTITAEEICRNHPSATVQVLATSRGGVWHPAPAPDDDTTAVTILGFTTDGPRQVALSTSHGTMEPVRLGQRFHLAQPPQALPTLPDLGGPAALEVLDDLAADLDRIGRSSFARGCRLLRTHLEQAVVTPAEVPRQLRAMTGDDKGRELAGQAATRLTRMVGIPVSVGRLRAGDVVTLPGGTAPRKVSRVAWLTEWAVHQVVLEGGVVRCFPAAGLTKAVLHERPGYGPFDHIYQVGDRVQVWWVGKRRLGRVVQVLAVPAPEHPADACYVINTGSGSTDGPCVGVEDMQPESTPLPAPGQVWQACETGRVFKVVAVAENGLAARDETGLTVELASPHWRLVEQAPQGDGVPGWGHWVTKAGVSSPSVLTSNR